MLLPPIEAGPELAAEEEAGAEALLLLLLAAGVVVLEVAVGLEGAAPLKGGGAG